MKDLIYIKDNALNSDLVHRVRKAYELEAALTEEDIDKFEKESNITIIDELGTRKFAHRGIARGTSGRGLDLNAKNSYDLNFKRGQFWWDLVLELEAEMRYFMREHLIQTVYSKDLYPSEKYDNVIEMMDNYSTNSPTFFPVQQVQHYKMNEGHFNNFHYDDTFDREIIYKHPYKPEKYVIRRLFVVMFYLNTVKEGGETQFRYTDTSIKPVEGRGVIFPASFPYMHRGIIPTSSDKLILTTWLCLDPSKYIARHYNSRNKKESWASLPLIPERSPSELTNIKGI
tara:strand:- start:3743 stop:4597 length:855 start_codon:yes stop_codon:yes gene_type:complete